MHRLLHLKGAWPYLIAIFLNAFVDLSHKIVIQKLRWRSTGRAHRTGQRAYPAAVYFTV